MQLPAASPIAASAPSPAPPRTTAASVAPSESPKARPVAAAVDKWVVSETMSPIDYSPIAMATASSLDGQWGLPIKLSIECRHGRNDIVFAGPMFARAEEYGVSYSLDEGRTWTVAMAMQPPTLGLALKGDAVPFLHALPRVGTLVFRFADHSGVVVDSRYSLPAMKSVLDRLASVCHWPGK